MDTISELPCKNSYNVKQWLLYFLHVIIWHTVDTTSVDPCSFNIRSLAQVNPKSICHTHFLVCAAHFYIMISDCRYQYFTSTLIVHRCWRHIQCLPLTQLETVYWCNSTRKGIIFETDILRSWLLKLYITNQLLTNAIVGAKEYC